MADCFVGEIRMFAGLRVPEYWKVCEGQVLRIADYEALYAAIGVTYGGNGTTTFALPDMRGRIPVHAGSGAGLTTRYLGQNLGVDAVTLSSAQIPAHSHAVSATSADAVSGSPVGAIFASPPGDRKFYVPSSATGTTPQKLDAQSITYTGGGQPHENRMPAMAVQFMIATRGIFPTPH